MFEAYFSKRWRATPLGMSGDTVAYLRWRLEHGELPKARHPRVAVLLVGTNDLRDAKALYEYEAGDGATAAGRSAAVADAARDIGSRCHTLSSRAHVHWLEAEVALESFWAHSTSSRSPD